MIASLLRLLAAKDATAVFSHLLSRLPSGILIDTMRPSEYKPRVPKFSSGVLSGTPFPQPLI